MWTNEGIPFAEGDWLTDRRNPGQPGQFTGRSRKSGPIVLLELLFPDGSTRFRPLNVLEAMSQLDGTVEGRLRSGKFGGARDLQRLITFEKLRGALHEVIYSMEAAQIDFYPYQFKPVLKLVGAPTERLIIADEVGLGKTIESALIWLELQARRQARRLLVVCPKLLAEKWREELRQKFLVDARIVGFDELQRELEETRTRGPAHAFALIATYTGLRPPKADLRSLREPGVDGAAVSDKTKLLRMLRHETWSWDPFDLVIFDEAHYMRNPATTTFHLGESLAANAGAVLCVSATPVNNSNTDLHSLLRLVDESFFESQILFEDLLEANRPTVQASNALAQIPVNNEMLQAALAGMGESKFIRESPLFKQFEERISTLDSSDKAQLAKCQDLAEKLNLLGTYVNRTRRVQVKENRPIREPHVLAVEYSPEEMKLYKTILQIVRSRCRADSRPFHVFQVLGLQLRAASCLPALAEEIREGRFGDPDNLLGEAFGDVDWDDFFEESMADEIDAEGLRQLLDHDFEADDSKYKLLRHMLLELMPDEKVVVFAYYRKTLTYLCRRLVGEGLNVTVIHGGIPNEDRWREIERFKDPRGPRVLLSSEVGSEGIDLQFCRALVNYDLPWNPMRVEQRIGRIDRVGQQEQILSITNFKVKDTVEERLYDRLHAKLERFANSLGDLEATIGKEVQKLTVDLLSRDLTPQQERHRMDQTERVIEQRLLHLQALEDSGEVLVALSDYLQRKIEEHRGKGRYIQPEELEDYLMDFFDREFRGCELDHNTPVEGCFVVRLTPEAHASLREYIREDRSLSAQPFWLREFGVTFRRDVVQRIPYEQRRDIHFTNHLSPLIRWITKVNRDRSHAFFNVSAMRLAYNELPTGIYCYRIERWKLTGISSREHLAYGVVSLSNSDPLIESESERVVQALLRQAKDWDRVECDPDSLESVYRLLEGDLAERFDEEARDFSAENETALQIRVQRVKGFYDRQIAAHEQRLRTLREGGRGQRVMRATEGLLARAQETRKNKLADLEGRADIDVEQAVVAAGIFKVEPMTDQ